jgi:hypothetical protein
MSSSGPDKFAQICTLYFIIKRIHVYVFYVCHLQVAAEAMLLTLEWRF